MSKRSANARGRGTPPSPSVPPPSQVAYHGRIDKPIAVTGVTVNLHEAVGISSTAGGVVSYLDDYSPATTTNWSEYSTSWVEYRVLGIKYHYMPTYKVNMDANGTIINDAPVVFTVLHSSTVPSPTNISEAWAYSNNQKVDSLMREKVVIWRMSDTYEAEFQATGVPSATINSVLFQSYGASASLSYGTMFITYLVQFRGTRK